jgi:hypothetical protein
VGWVCLLKHAVIEQLVNIEFCVKLSKTSTETYEMLEIVYGDEALNRSSVFAWFKELMNGVRIFRMIQEAGVLQPLEMQTQSQLFVKW